MRKELAFGNQIDYFDHLIVLGWVRQGIEENPRTGCTVIMSNGAEGYKEMDLGKKCH